MAKLEGVEAPRFSPGRVNTFAGVRHICDSDHFLFYIRVYKLRFILLLKSELGALDIFYISDFFFLKMRP